MIRLIRFLFTGDWHLHEWEEVERGERRWGRSKVGNYYDCRCKHCGKIKAFNT